MGVSVTIAGNKELKEYLNKLEGKLDDMTEFNRDFADLELNETMMRFEKQIDPNGNPWAIPDTTRRNPAPPPKRKKFGPGDKILRDTGALYNSFGRAFGPDFAEVGTNISYAKYHQKGQGVKKRSMLGVSKATIENIKNLIKYYLKGK